MKILSWNIERPKINDSRKAEIIKIINSYNADLIFLTETNSDINFKDYHCISSKEQTPKYEHVSYSLGENKVSIFSKYRNMEQIETYDKFSAVCCKIESEFGPITLYGSIIGFLGGRDTFFEHDFKNQKEDIRKICLHSTICFSGDFNISFSGYPYPSKKIRNEMKVFLESNNLLITTAANNDSAIHTAISNSFIGDKKVKTKMVSIKRELSDHNLVLTEII